MHLSKTDEILKGFCVGAHWRPVIVGGRRWKLAREGIEVRPYLAESKDIFEKPDKVTLKLDPQKVWLLANVLGRWLRPRQQRRARRAPKTARRQDTAPVAARSRYRHLSGYWSPENLEK